MSVYTLSTYYININDSSYSHNNFFYFNNNKTTLKDLFEYIAMVYISRNICKCNEFPISDNGSNYLKANEDEILYKYYQKSSSYLYINITQSNCICDQKFKTYFDMSKTKIINSLLEQENKMNQENEKYTQNIKNFENEKNVLNQYLDLKNNKIKDNETCIEKLEKESSNQKVKIENLEI